jgi:hypothetical protein
LGNPAPRRNGAAGMLRGKAMRYGLLWLLGVPIPVLIIIWLLFN